MRSCVYITNPSWLAVLAAADIRDSVNFWRKDSRTLGLLAGDLFYLKLRGTTTIAGRAYFREQQQMTLLSAWERYGDGNGAKSLTQFRESAVIALGLKDENINCLVLDGLQILPEGKRPSISLSDFPHGIKNCKFFETGQLSAIDANFVEGADLPSLKGLQDEAEKAPSFDPRYISTARAATLRSICSRRGQSRFRNKLLTAYEYQCCVSGERCSHVLEAAHIHPYAGSDTDHPTNGLLIRSDWHTLFDLGLWTVDDEFKMKISRGLIGSPYAGYEGMKIRVPNKTDLKPSPAALKYHRDKIFRP